MDLERPQKTMTAEGDRIAEEHIIDTLFVAAAALAPRVQSALCTYLSIVDALESCNLQRPECSLQCVQLGRDLPTHDTEIIT